MTLNNLSNTIALLIEKYGKTCTLTLKDGKVITTKVMAEHLWKRDKTRFENNPTGIGFNQKNYVIGDFVIDVTAFGKDDIMTFMGKEYYFVKSSAVCVGEEPVYYTAVLRESVKGDEDVFG